RSGSNQRDATPGGHSGDGNEASPSEARTSIVRDDPPTMCRSKSERSEDVVSPEAQAWLSEGEACLTSGCAVRPSTVQSRHVDRDRLEVAASASAAHEGSHVTLQGVLAHPEVGQSSLATPTC